MFRPRYIVLPALAVLLLGSGGAPAATLAPPAPRPRRRLGQGCDARGRGGPGAEQKDRKGRQDDVVGSEHQRLPSRAGPVSASCSSGQMDGSPR